LTLDVEIIKIRIAAHLLRRVVEQAKTVSHEVRKRVRHFQLRPNWLPDFAIQAVEEVGYILFVLEIAFGFKIDFGLA
jgi:hypothetical protein